MSLVGERNWTRGRSQTLLTAHHRGSQEAQTDTTVTCHMLLLHLIQSSSLCCLVCVCFVQAVCSINNQQDPRALLTSSGDDDDDDDDGGGMGFGLPENCHSPVYLSQSARSLFKR